MRVCQIGPGCIGQPPPLEAILTQGLYRTHYTMANVSSLVTGASGGNQFAVRDPSTRQRSRSPQRHIPHIRVNKLLSLTWLSRHADGCYVINGKDRQTWSRVHNIIDGRFYTWWSNHKYIQRCKTADTATTSANISEGQVISTGTAQCCICPPLKHIAHEWKGYPSDGAKEPCLKRVDNPKACVWCGVAVADNETAFLRFSPFKGITCITCHQALRDPRSVGPPPDGGRCLRWTRILQGWDLRCRGGKLPTSICELVTTYLWPIWYPSSCHRIDYEEFPDSSDDESELGKCFRLNRRELWVAGFQEDDNLAKDLNDERCQLLDFQCSIAPLRRGSFVVRFEGSMAHESPVMHIRL